MSDFFFGVKDEEGNVQEFQGVQEVEISKEMMEDKEFYDDLWNEVSNLSGEITVETNYVPIKLMSPVMRRYFKKIRIVDTTYI